MPTTLALNYAFKLVLQAQEHPSQATPNIASTWAEAHTCGWEHVLT